jgi:hypothetical protein
MFRLWRNGMFGSRHSQRFYQRMPAGRPELQLLRMATAESGGARLPAKNQLTGSVTRRIIPPRIGIPVPTSPGPGFSRESL